MYLCTASCEGASISTKIVCYVPRDRKLPFKAYYFMITSTMSKIGVCIGFLLQLLLKQKSFNSSFLNETKVDNGFSTPLK